MKKEVAVINDLGYSGETMFTIYLIRQVENQIIAA